MPTMVICTPCGGRGYREFLMCTRVEDWFYPDLVNIVWFKEVCQPCKGAGQVEELTWQEIKAQKEVEDVNESDSKEPV